MGGIEDVTKYTFAKGRYSSNVADPYSELNRNAVCPRDSAGGSGPFRLRVRNRFPLADNGRALLLSLRQREREEKSDGGTKAIGR